MVSRDATGTALRTGTVKSSAFADRVAQERVRNAAAQFDSLSSTVIDSILANSDREQAATLLDVLNDSGDLSIATGCMVAAQLMANVIRDLEPEVQPFYVSGIARLALEIVTGHAQAVLLADTPPAGSA